MEDEAWRDGLTDEVAARLLDEALKGTDAKLARLAEAGKLTEESAYDAADEARRGLMERAGASGGGSGVGGGGGSSGRGGAGSR